MKTESKQELRERILYLENKNEDLRRQLEAHKMQEWIGNIGEAQEIAKKELNSSLGAGNIKYIYYNRVDSSGYWFVYELIDGAGPRVFRLGHSSIMTPEEKAYRRGYFEGTANAMRDIQELRQALNNTNVSENAQTRNNDFGV